MNGLRLTALLVYTFGAFAYGGVLFLWVRQRAHGGWAAHPRRRTSGSLDVVGGSLFGLGFLWFLDNLLLTLVGFGPRREAVFLQFAQLCLALMFPPVIMHVTYTEVYRDRPARPRLARTPIWLAYAVTQGISVFTILTFLGVIHMDWRRTVAFANYALVTTFLAAAVYSIAVIVRKGRTSQTRRELQARRWLIGAFGFMLLLFLVLLANPGVPSAWMAFAGAIQIASRSLPLVFMFVGTYFQNRFGFFDLFVKRGLSLLLTIGALTAYFAFVAPRLRPFDASWAASWIYAITLLPVIGILVWLYRVIARTLDRRWLGRRYTTEEAVKRFIAALQSATTEAQLIAHAQQGLEEIFGAPVHVELDDVRDAPPFAAQEEIPVGPKADPAGRIVMGARGTDAPYFSEDLALLASLADVLASVLDNLRLQQRKLEQEQLARELSLNASRSELKALRAQINPHFLFNALNAIAGLIHQNPANADRTIEQLAEVFRYALRGSDSEWAVLGEELDFVRAYLDVERARFGERLRAEVRVADGASQALVPTMVVQTLVENAMKHGVAAVLGPAVVEVDARRDDDRIVVSVIDNGPGFVDTPPRQTASRRGGGYGLVNIRQRLEGYFGDAARLSIDRDERRGLTIVSVSLPFTSQAPPSPGADLPRAKTSGPS